METPKDWRYVTLDERELLLDKASNQGWRAFLSLCRLAGLRQGEALELTWGKIDWDRHRITVHGRKTNKMRVVPMEPRLEEILLEAYDSAPEGEELVCHGVLFNNRRRTFHKLCGCAGLIPWKSWCHTLRKNAETDWAQRFPIYAVARWLGHSVTVSERHYLQVPEELFDKVARKRPEDVIDSSP